MTTLFEPTPNDVTTSALDLVGRRLQSAFTAIPPQHNEHETAAHYQLRDWVEQFHLLATPDLAARFWHADFPGFVAITYPTVDVEALALVTDWFAWLFILDDTLDDGPTGRDMARTSELMAALAAVVQQSPGTPSNRRHRQPIVAALADLWARTTTRASQDWVDRFVHHVITGMAAAAWEARNRTTGVMPSPEHYIEQRRHTGAIYVCMDLIDVSSMFDLSPAAYDDERFQAALDAACDAVCWTNDLYSLDKETQLGEFHNLVAVMAHHHQLTLDAATDVVGDMIADRVAEFLQHRRQLLASSPQPEVVRSVAGMQSWMRGNFDWSRATLRYREAATRRIDP